MCDNVWRLIVLVFFWRRDGLNGNISWWVLLNTCFVGFCSPNVNLSVGPKVCFFFYMLNFQRGCRQRVRGRQLTYGVRVNREIDRLITFHFNGTPDSSYNDARGMSVAAV